MNTQYEIQASRGQQVEAEWKLRRQDSLSVSGYSGRLAGIRRTCEERIITFLARDGRAALREAKRQGRSAQHSYKNNDGNPVHFEFVGVLELLRLDPACEINEVWYDITERVRPMERRASIIPSEIQLSAIRNHD